MLSKKIGAFTCALIFTVALEGPTISQVRGESLAAADNTEIVGPLSSGQAINLLLQHNQEIKALGWQIKSKKAAALQDALLPNPELNIEVENFAGSGALDGFDSSESTVSLSQLIELGGKRQMRRSVGRIAVDMTVMAYQAKSLELVANVQQAFIDVLAAQEKLKIAEEQQKIAKEVTSVVKARVQAGKVSPIESIKAQVALSTSRIKLNNAKRQLSNSRNALALSWGSTTPQFSNAVGSLMDIALETASLEPLMKLLVEHPLMQQATLAVELSQAKLRLAQVRSVPDLTVSGGYRNFADNNNHAFVAGISFPLPTFDRNQGGISEAAHNLARNKSNLAALKTKMATALNTVVQNLLADRLEIETISEKVLPSARSTFDAVQEGYRQGKFSYLEVLDAQKTLFDVTLGRIEALRAYHANDIQLRHLTGSERNLLPKSQCSLL